jgi:hypothetical protein
MRIEDKTYVETTMSGGTAFTIEDSPKIFRVLSKNIYKNQIMAFIRELVTNAADAHIDAGRKNTPIDVKLPSALDHSFYVRDYGTGMSKSDLLLIYKTYFKSTKTDTNATDGMYGLGSKSPFAYSNDFTVEDYYNGWKHTYLAMFDQDDRPQFVPISEDEPTKEPNGIKVIITIKTADFDRVASEAVRVLSFVDANINLIADQKIVTRLNDTKAKMKPGGNGFVFEDSDVLILKSSVFSGLSNIAKYNVIQGNVCYPVDTATLSSIIPIEVIGNYVSNDLQYFFKFNRGDIYIPPSREEISYDKIYVKRVIEKSEKVIEQITKDIDKQLKNVSTYFEYADFIIKYRRKLGGSISFLDQLFYTKEFSNDSQTFKKKCMFENPFDDSVTVVTRAVIDDLRLSNVQAHLFDNVSNIVVELGEVCMSRDIRGKMQRGNIKVDEYKADVARFKRRIHFSPKYEIHEEASAYDKEIYVASNMTPQKIANTYRFGFHGAIYIVKQDDVKPCTMTHFTKLMSDSVLGSRIYFTDSADFDFEKAKKLNEISVKLRTILELNVTTSQIQIVNSSDIINKYLGTAKTDVFRGIDIKVSTFERKMIAQYSNFHAHQSVVEKAEECQKLIENPRYLIVRTYSHESDISFKFNNVDIKITDKSDVEAILRSMVVLDEQFLNDYDGILFIKKTSYDKLEKKEIDMSNLLDHKIAEFYTKFEMLFEMADYPHDRVNFLKTINKLLEERKVKCDIISSVVSRNELILTNMKKFNNMNQHNRQNIIASFNTIRRLSKYKLKKNSIQYLINSAYDKYTMLSFVSLHIATPSQNVVVADYIAAMI